MFAAPAALQRRDRAIMSDRGGRRVGDRRARALGHNPRDESHRRSSPSRARTAALRSWRPPEPEPSHMLTPGEGVLVDVHAAGVSFPELLQTRGAIPAQTAAAVRARERGRRRRPQRPGRRVGQGGRPRRGLLRAGRLRGDRPWRPSSSPSRSRPSSTSPRAPALILNYHTAYFALVLRGAARAGRVGARPRRGGRRRDRLRCRSPRAVGARTIALVSSAEKRRRRRRGRRG